MQIKLIIINFARRFLEARQNHFALHYCKVSTRNFISFFLYFKHKLETKMIIPIIVIPVLNNCKEKQYQPQQKQKGKVLRVKLSNLWIHTFLVFFSQEENLLSYKKKKLKFSTFFFFYLYLDMHPNPHESFFCTNKNN